MVFCSVPGDVDRGDYTRLRDGRSVANGRPLDRRETIFVFNDVRPHGCHGRLGAHVKN
jgi:hypothetical protein